VTLPDDSRSSVTDDAGPGVGRRTVLAALAGVGGVGLAGCTALEPEPDGETSKAAEEAAADLAMRFAPTLYFDAREPWFPTDPRPYASERNGDPVVDGFDAVDGYHERFDGEDPPDPTVFYNVVEYEESPLAAVQYWFYRRSRPSASGLNPEGEGRTLR
jgi:hypothetical protein